MTLSKNLQIIRVALVLNVICTLYIIPAESCGGDENAIPGCGMACVKKCSNFWRDDIMCTADCELNGCSCKEGLVYDENIGKCVNFWECSPVCGQNEKFSNCTNGDFFGARNCTEADKPVKCAKVHPKDCEMGCICEEGFLRNENGVCVAKDECSANKQCKGHNEFYDICPPSCAPQTCESIGKVIHCPIQTTVCKPSCRCAKGYYRNSKGECILERYCPQSCPENEYWSGCSNGGCFGPKNCAQIGRGIICVDLIPGACKGGCLCNDGLLRNNEGVCVQPSQCPPVQDDEDE